MSGARSCPICGELATTPMLSASDRNRRSTSERFDYRRCDSCGTVFLAEPPLEPARHYISNYHQFEADGTARWQADEEVMDYQRERAALLHGRSGPGRLVDVGAGPGAFAAAAKRAGFEVTAIEMDEGCCEFMRNGLGIKAVCSDRPGASLKQLEPARAITLWHVLEHLPDPANMLAACAQQLEPGGVLAVGLPNPESLQFKLLRSRWVHLDAPRHLCLIPAPALIAAARNHGLHPVELTTDDSVGRALNNHGWVSAMRAEPGEGRPSRTQMALGLAIGRALSPVERRGHRGAGYTLLLQRAGA